MRHLSRLYFKNSTPQERFVALIDQGVSAGNPVFNFIEGNFSDPMTVPEATNILQALQFCACFFKLPQGAHAIVDVYIPDVLGSSDPKTFDYQVFEAKDAVNGESRTKRMEAFRAAHKVSDDKTADYGINSTQEDLSTGDPTGPNASAFTSISGTCAYYSSGPSGPSSPCGGQSSTSCQDPILTRASCVQGTLTCVSFEPPGPPPHNK